MGIVENFEQFSSIYHNNRDVNINSIIFNNKNGIEYYKYGDIRDKDTLVYYGQKKGRCDKYIKEGKTLYLERDKATNEYNYIGLIKDINIERENGINKFIINLDRKYIHNGIKCGDKLKYINTIKKGKGSYCFKKSALLRLGFKIQGNLCSGILKVDYDY